MEGVFQAEWVVHNDLADASSAASDTVVLYLHGGGYCLLNPASHRPLVIAMSKVGPFLLQVWPRKADRLVPLIGIVQAMNVRVFSVDYRLAPESPFPGGLRDAVEAYYYLLAQGVPAQNIIVSGDSAGGGLSMALLLYLRDHPGLHTMIGGGLLLSPWCDLSSSLGSWISNKDVDYLTVADKNDKSLDLAHLYLTHESFAELVVHPYVSSAIADLRNLPPLLIQSGGAEVLRDEVTLLAERAHSAGVDVELVVLDGGIHVGTFFLPVSSLFLDAYSFVIPLAQAFVHTELAKSSIAQMGEWLSRQAPPTPFDVSKIDALIRSNYTPKSVRTAAAASPRLGPFSFTLVDERAPMITLKEGAHPALVKAVRENEQSSEPKVGMTKLLRASRNERGMWQRARGALHL